MKTLTRRGIASVVGINPTAKANRAKDVTGPRVRYQHGDALPWKLEQAHLPKDGGFTVLEQLSEHATEQEAERRQVEMMQANNTVGAPG